MEIGVNMLPGGPDGSPEPAKDVPEGKPQPTYGRAQPVNVARYARVFASVVVVVIALLFVIRNSQTVEVSLVFVQSNVPLYVALLIAMVLGAALGSGGLWWFRRRRSKVEPSGKER